MIIVLYQNTFTRPTVAARSFHGHRTLWVGSWNGIFSLSSRAQRVREFYYSVNRSSLTSGINYIYPSLGEATDKDHIGRTLN